MRVFSPEESSPQNTGKVRPIHRGWPWLAALYLLVTVGTWFLPLANELQYELAALMAVTASLITGLGILTSSRSLLDLPDSGGEEALRDRRALWWAIARSLLLSLIPLAADLLRIPFVGGCGIAEGVGWYLLLVPPAALISLVIALFCTLLTERRWLRIVLFFLLWSGSLLRGAYEGYTGPHIFLYAWQIGFFPGGSWDPELPITLRVILYRLLHLALTAGLATVILELRRTKRSTPGAFASHASVAIAFLVAAVALALIPFRSDLGLSRTDAWLRNELGDSLRTRHAVIYYNAPRTDSLTIWRAANLTDFYIERHAEALGLPLDQVQPVIFYLYPNAEIQKEYVGTSSASFTKPWGRKLNIPADRIEGTLEHELAHVVIAPFGNVLGISWSQGLLEGAAVALTRDYGWMTLHEYAYAAYAVLKPPPIEQIMGTGGFTSLGSSLSYVLAGSFSRWLIDTYGMERYVKVYRSSDFSAIYGRDLHQLSGEYQRFLAGQRPAGSWSSTAMRYLFGGGSFFEQHCLRRIGTLNRRAFEAMGAERYELALSRFNESLAEGTNYTARAGVLQALMGMGRYQRMLDSVSLYFRDSLAFPLLPFLIETGDARWALGDTDGAERSYRTILQSGIGTTLSTRAALRLYFLRAPQPLSGIMRGYFVRPLKQLQRIETLRTARRAARTASERTLLDLMIASWTSAQLPRSTAGWLADAEAEPFAALPEPHDEVRSLLEPFVISSVRRTIADAILYATLLPGDLPPLGDLGNMDLPFPPDSLVEHENAALRLLLPTPRSLNDERTERRAFITFLRKRPILP